MVYISYISNKQRLNRYFIDINQPNQSVKNMIQSRILSMNLSNFLLHLSSIFSHKATLH